MKSLSSSSCFPLSVSLQRRPLPIAGVSPGRQLPPRRSSCTTWPLARPPAAHPTPLDPPRVDASRRCPPEPPRTLSTTSSCLLPARTPLFGFGTRLVNFSLLLFPRAHPYSFFLLHSTTLSTVVSRLCGSSLPISCSTSTAASHCPFLTRSSSCSRARSPEHCAGDLTPHRCPVSSRTEVPPLLPRQEHHQHHISTPKLPDQFHFAFLRSGRRNTAAALGTSPRRLCP
jgi:hypothetical protein